MKKLFCFLLSVGMTMGFLTAESEVEKSARVAKQVQSEFTLARAALARNNPDQALLHYANVLNLDPGNGRAIAETRRISRNKGSYLIQKKKRAFQAVIIPELDINDESLADALDILLVHVRKSEDPDVVKSIIVQDPAGLLKDKTVRMKTGALPAHVALGYILKQAGARYTMDEYAIVVVPAERAGGAVKPETPVESVETVE